MDELNPELKRKLDDAARNAPPDYPDWKRGIGCGAAALILCALIFGIIAAVFSQKHYWGIDIGLTLIFTLSAVGIAAFRPRK